MHKDLPKYLNILVFQYKPLVNRMIAYSGETPVNTRKTNCFRKKWKRKNKNLFEHDSLYVQGITFPNKECYYFDTVRRNKCKL